MKKIWKRSVCSVLAVSMIASLFVGCQSDSSNTSSQNAGNSSSTAKMETVRVWTNDTQYKATFEPVIKKYNEGQGLKDGINVEYKLFGDDYADVLKVALAASQGPELYKFVGTVKEPFITSKWMLPIDDLPGGPEFLSKYKDILINGYTTFNGKSYSVPFKVLTTKFMYNKDLLKKSGFENPPKTWDDVVSYAKKITKDNAGNAYGYGVHLKDSASSGKWYFAAQFASSVGHMGYDFKTGKFRFSDFTKNIQKILQMKADGSVFPGGEGMDVNALLAQFAAGRVAMIPGVSWDASNLGDLKHSFALGVCDTPVIDSTHKYKNYAQIADVLCVGASAANMPEKAMKVYALFHSDEVQVEIQNNEVDFMARADIQKQKPATFKKEGIKEFGDTSNSYFTMTPPDGGITVEGQPYQNTIVNLVAGSTSEDVAGVLADLDKRYNAALDKAVAGGFNLSQYVDKNWNTEAK